jgi:hypothetical protein
MDRVKSIPRLRWGVALVLTVFAQILGAAQLARVICVARVDVNRWVISGIWSSPTLASTPPQVERSVFGKVTWRF